MKAILIITFAFGGLVGEVQSFQPVPNMTQCEIAKDALVVNPPVLRRNGSDLEYSEISIECKSIAEISHK